MFVRFVALVRISHFRLSFLVELRVQGQIRLKITWSSPLLMFCQMHLSRLPQTGSLSFPEFASILPSESLPTSAPPSFPDHMTAPFIHLQSLPPLQLSRKYCCTSYPGCHPAVLHYELFGRDLTVLDCTRWGSQLDCVACALPISTPLPSG